MQIQMATAVTQQRGSVGEVPCRSVPQRRRRRQVAIAPLGIPCAHGGTHTAEMRLGKPGICRDTRAVLQAALAPLMSFRSYVSR